MTDPLKIIQLIDQGENTAIEFKREDVKPENMAKELVAFANSSGGTILLGVENDGTVSGISNPKINEEWVSNIAWNNVIPALDVVASKVSIDGKGILCVEVPKGKDKPYQTNKYQFLIRAGTTNRVATQSELLRLFQQSGLLHYDKCDIENTSSNLLNESKIDAYFNLFDIAFAGEPKNVKERLLINADILTPDHKVSIAGMLCFGTNPAKYLHQSGIAFAHFKGNNITDELIDRQMIEGTLDHVIDTTLAVIKNNIKNPSIIVGAKREETADSYPDKVFRELITNACAHRDYSITGSQIRVFIFDNRIEVRSPGKLPNTLSIEKIKVGAAFSRNPVITRFLVHTRYADRFGRGIPMVIQEAKKLNKKVHLEEFGEEFIVTLYL